MADSTTDFPTRTLRKTNGCYDVDCERWAAPMTTAWTAPSGCPQVISSALTKGCEVPHWANVVYNDGYYSPGLCMSGYTVASGCVRTGMPSMTVNGELVTESETAAFCVPTGFVCGYNPIANTDSKMLRVKWAVQETQSANSIVTEYVVAVQIRWRSEDLPFLQHHPLGPFADMASTTTDSSETGPSAAASLEASATMTSDPSQPNVDGNPGPSHTGLTGGVIAGITIGVIVAVALVSVAGWLCIRRRKRHSSGQEDEQEQPRQARDQVTSWTKSELEAPTVGVYSPGRNETSTPLPHPSHRESSFSQNSDFAQFQARVGSPVELAMGNDIEVAGPLPSEHMPVDHHPGMAGSAEERFERQQLLQRRRELTERRATLELERIDAEERAIEHRLSQLLGRN
ncbi:hypothetical protein ACHAQA_000663 [Verticillium albo-atrum]